MRTAHDRLVCYCFAMLAVLAASFVRLRLDPLLGGAAPFTLFLPAVALAALLGGGGPGIAAALLGLAEGRYYFIEPRFRIAAGDADGAAEEIAYVVASFLLVGAISALRRARRPSNGAD